MTSQTKKFIDLTDFLALRFECKSCGSTLVIPSTRNLEQREEQGKLSDCPVCRKPWASVGGSTCEPEIARFLAALSRLNDLLSRFPAGFTLTLEVKPDLTLPLKDGK